MPKLHGKNKQFCSKKDINPSRFMTCDIYEKLAKDDFIGKKRVMIIHPIKKGGFCTVGYNSPKGFVKLYGSSPYIISSNPDKSTHSIRMIGTNNINEFQNHVRKLCY